MPLMISFLRSQKKKAQINDNNKFVTKCIAAICSSQEENYLQFKPNQLAAETFIVIILGDPG